MPDGETGTVAKIITFNIHGSNEKAHGQRRPPRINTLAQRQKLQLLKPVFSNPPFMLVDIFILFYFDYYSEEERSN
jgi:hypothetical protein